MYRKSSAQGWRFFYFAVYGYTYGMDTQPQHLGIKTFWIFVFRNSRPAFFLVIISIVLFIVQGYVPHQFALYVPYVTDAALLAIGLAIIMAAFGLLSGWLTYINYTFTLDTDAFKIRKGILSHEETALPYRQIQTIDLKQDLIGRMIGVSQLVILTAGHEDANEPVAGESEGEFPVIDSALASTLRDELLKHTDVERVTIQQPTA